MVSKESVTAMRQKLRTFGFATGVCGGIQIDVNVARRQVAQTYTEASICDHNCTEERGGYTCPASFSLPDNHGLKKSTMAPARQLLEWINFGTRGVRQAMERFLELHFASFCLHSRIDDEAVREALWLELFHAVVEINLFGGNPEMLPELVPLLAELRAQGNRYNLTTTGRRWLTDPDFPEKLKGIEPTVLALSLDDLTIQDLRRLGRMTLKQIREDWDGVDKLAGQSQKAREAVYVLRLYQERGGYPGVSLLNMVLHAGNIDHVDEMFEVVEQVAPGTMLNPYADQKAFAYQPGKFGEREVGLFEGYTDGMIELSKNPNARISKKMSHHLLHKARINRLRGNRQATADAIAGHGTWKCYRRTGSGFYVQIGRSPDAVIPISSLKAGVADGPVHPGGHLGCYWNPDTVTQSVQVTSARQVFEHVMYGNKSLADKSVEPCPGCRMPRLDSANMVILEQGIDDDQDPGLRPEYLRLRQQHAGF